MRNRETEVKLPVANLKAIQRRLEEMGFRPLHRRSLEDNFLFDTPDRALRKVRSILRLRHYGGRWITTFKGTPAADPLYKSRAEFETEIADPEAVSFIFEALGFQPVFRYQKYRSHYVPAETAAAGKKKPSRKELARRRPSPIEVALDETPIGNYIELEGSRRSIDRVARALGFARTDYTTASYGALYLEHCLKNNLPPGDMVFAAPTGRRQRKPSYIPS